MDYVLAFNALEACLWTLLGTMLVYRAARQPEFRTRFLLAAVGFFAFAGSELMEMQTGAWWRPWWLLAWKAACITLLVSLGVHHSRHRATNPADDTSGGCS